MIKEKPKSHLWILGVVLCLTNSFCLSTGTNVMRKAFIIQSKLKLENRKALYCVPLWWLGFTLVTVFSSVLVVFSFSLTSASIVTALTGVHLLATNIVAFFILGEKLTILGMLSCCVICIGVVLVVYFGAKETPPLSEDFLTSERAVIFICCNGLFLLTLNILHLLFRVDPEEGVQNTISDADDINNNAASHPLSKCEVITEVASSNLASYAYNRVASSRRVSSVVPIDKEMCVSDTHIDPHTPTHAEKKEKHTHTHTDPHIKNTHTHTHTHTEIGGGRVFECLVVKSNDRGIIWQIALLASAGLIGVLAANGGLSLKAVIHLINICVDEKHPHTHKHKYMHFHKKHIQETKFHHVEEFYYEWKKTIHLLICVSILFLSVVFQIFYMTKALTRFAAIYTAPISSAITIFVGTLGGQQLYGEVPAHALGFWLACVVIAGGILGLTLSNEGDKKVEEEECALLENNTHTHTHTDIHTPTHIPL
eukprot:GHVR01009486.1.p1 GENE.GHVR01009486.1~~GHVR01009486.1.p1  ORF type:complete len:481 (+),score=150.21 GHVR01009486.1:589-2031(+)